MRRLPLVLTAGAAVAGGVGYYLLSAGPDRARCFERVEFVNRTTESAGFIHAVSADGMTLSIGASSGGPSHAIEIIAPSGGQDVKVLYQGEAIVGITFGQCDPEPEPTASATAEPPPTTPPPTAPPTAPPSTPPPPGGAADDPPGLERSGDGRFSKGSSGPSGQGRGRVITVTSAKGDTSEGTIRWAFAQISGPAKVVLSSVLDGQTITFPANFQLKWDKPYTTLDCSQSNVRFKTANDQPFSQGIVIGGTHDVIFYSCGGIGWFNEAKPQVPANNMSVISLANFVPVRYSWDDKWDATPATFRGTNRDILLDRMGCTNAQDDCLAVYDGARNVSITRFLNRRAWHPMTCGSNGFKPEGDPKERTHVTWAYGVEYMLGARGARVWRGCRDWTFYGNIVARWWPWVAPAGVVNPNGGLWLEDDAAGENDRGYVVNNLGVPDPANCKSGQLGPSCDPTMACFVGGSSRCDATGQGAPGDYRTCNPKMTGTRWYFQGNTWGGSKDCVTNPPGYVPAAGSYPTLAARPWSRVLAEAGPVKRLPAEQADIDWIAARVAQ